MIGRKRQATRRPVPGWVKRLWLSVVGLGGISILIGLSLIGWRAAQVWNRWLWYRHEPYRILVIRTEPTLKTVAGVNLISIWPDTNEVRSVAIPPVIKIPSVGGYGNYQVSALATLGKVEGVGNQLLTDSVSLTLGIPIHQVCEVKTTGQTVPLGDVKRQIFETGLLGKRSLPEAVVVWQLLSQAKIREMKVYELTDKNVVRQRPELDGTMAAYFEPALLERFVNDQLITVWKEAANLQVAIINASGKPQLATQWSRLVRFGGYDVVNVTDQQERKEVTVIRYRDQEKALSLPGKALHAMFPAAAVEVGDMAAYRADAAVILGNDQWAWLNDRQYYLSHLPLHY